jgi:hypothetical protein
MAGFVAVHGLVNRISSQSEKFTEADISTHHTPHPWQLINRIGPKKSADGWEERRPASSRAKAIATADRSSITTPQLVRDNNRAAGNLVSDPSDHEQSRHESNEEHTRHELLKYLQPK